jgi:alpha-mannosidase
MFIPKSAGGGFVLGLRKKYCAEGLGNVKCVHQNPEPFMILFKPAFKQFQAVRSAPNRFVFFVALFAFTLAPSANAGETLWNIGQVDQSSADLALGANHPDKEFIRSFPQDPFFIVGKSDPRHDWPAIQPGPVDAWANSGTHTFTVAFGLNAPVEGTCRLVLDLVDAQNPAPPQIVISVNNHPLPVQRPVSGNGDDVLGNHPETGHHQNLAFEFPGEYLQTNNLISIKTENGSWIIYDALHLETSAAAALREPEGISLGVVTADSSLVRQGQALEQALHVPIYRFAPSSTTAPLTATLSDGRGASRQIEVKPGPQTVDFAVPAVDQAAWVTVSLAANGGTYTASPVEMKHMRQWIIYVLPHSHHDLGYTDIQPHIVAKQMHNIDLALDQARQTKDFPPGARYIWNAEVLWSVDDYLAHYPDKEPQLIAAIREGAIYPNGWYANELTGLCRPEELLHLSTFGLKLAQKTGVPIDSAMISDVPGLSWGCIQALNEAGIRYLSDGPNYFDRIGHTLVDTEDKPFYWQSPSGHNKVLVWTSWRGYALAAESGPLRNVKTQERLISHLEKLEEEHYPYDMACIRWSGFGDNAAPDDGLAPFVKDWNQTHASPHFIIASTSTAFHALEDKYGRQIPTLRGEFTPYWEDGSGSSARETSLNREAAEQLVQAETLYALLQPRKAPVDSLNAAWRDVIMYDEHTWGAWNSVSSPNNPGVKEQWQYKQAFAVDAHQHASELLQQAANARGDLIPGQFDVFNTHNWTCSDVVTLSKDASAAGDVLKDAAGNRVPSQRLSTGELAFLAKDIPPLGAQRFTITAGPASVVSTTLRAGNLELANDWFTIKLDPKTGGITEWENKDHPGNLIDNHHANLNDYAYVLGGGLTNVQSSATPRITVKESGPLVASLLVEGSAPGARSFSREIKIYRDIPRIDILDDLDKTDVLEVEAGHVAFPFNLPDGQVRLDSQFAVTRPEIDQIPGANKNWFSVSRWADISNPQYGVTLATVDAPMIEVGGITATLVRSQGDPRVFRTKVDRTQTVYSWIFNNHWETNYKASQHGRLTYRFSLQTHQAYDALAASRFGAEASQPLLVFPARGAALAAPRMTINPDNLLLTAFKSSEDGKAWIARFFNPSDVSVTAKMNWAQPQPAGLWRSDMSEKPLEKINDTLTVPAWSLLTVRADF